MESASPEHQSEQPPGHHIANFIGILIATMTLTVPLYAISNFNTAGIAVPQQASPIITRAQE